MTAHRRLHAGCRSFVAVFTAACLLLVLGVLGCERRSADSAGQGAGAKASRGLVLGTIEEPDTLDPLFTEISGAREIVSLLYRDLTELDETWTVRPSLAKGPPSIETSTIGGLRVRWQLRPELRWSDGAPLTTSDLLFGYRIASDPTLETTSQQLTAEIANIRAPSPLELIVDWRHPYPGYDMPRVHPLIPRHAYPDPKTSPRPFRGLGRSPVSSGPYRLAEWVPGQWLRLEKNPNWKLDAPELPELTWRFFKTEDAFEAELRAGGIDALGEASGLSIERAAGMEERLKATHVVHYTDSGLWLHLEVRSDHPALSDARVRRAISRAIDRESMSRIVYAGKATPAYGCFPPRHIAHREIPREPRDVAAAEHLLDEAGFTRDAKTGARAKGNVKLELELQFASGSQASERAATFLQAQLAEIGVTVTLGALPMRIVFAKMREKSHAPLVLFAYRSNPDWDANAMLHGGGAQNYGSFKDAETDRLLDAAKIEADPARWAEALAKVEARYRELLPSIPLLFRKSVSIRPKTLSGWRPTGSMTPVTWNAEHWRWE